MPFLLTKLSPLFATLPQAHDNGDQDCGRYHDAQKVSEQVTAGVSPGNNIGDEIVDYHEGNDTDDHCY